jgi:hypothetical protein
MVMVCRATTYEAYLYRSYIVVALALAREIPGTFHYGRGKISHVIDFGEANLSRVLRSGKNYTRGREAFLSAAECLALGKGPLSRVQHSGKSNTRRRKMLLDGPSRPRR